MKSITTICLICLLLTGIASAAAPLTFEARDTKTLRAAIAQAVKATQGKQPEQRPAVTIRLAPGTYQGGVYIENLVGTRDKPAIFCGEDAKNPPVIVGGKDGLKFNDCSYLIIRDLKLRKQKDNGIQVTDGGDYKTPSHHILLERIHLEDIGSGGNNDGLKLSGVDDFFIRDCTIHGWDGQCVDMVGCHRGLITGCTFIGKKERRQWTGIQPKGGASDILIQNCLFDNAGMRAVNLGGTCGLPYFRPLDAKFEAKNLTVEHCTFRGSEAPIAYTNVDVATVRYCTFIEPNKWVMRILNESADDPKRKHLTRCRNGVFTNNIVLFSTKKVRYFANLSPKIDTTTFTFANNLWYASDNPAASKPKLPAVETGGVYGVNPQLTPVGEDLKHSKPQNPKASRYGATAIQLKK